MAITLNGTTNVITPKTAAQPTGSILQVVSIQKADTATSGAIANNQSAWWDYTDASFKLLITPSATSSKILLLGTINLGCNNTNLPLLQIMRDGSVAGAATSPGSRISVHTRYARTGQLVDSIIDYPIHLYDSPATTSQVAYNMRVGHGSGSATTFYLNRGDGDGNDYSYGRSISTHTAMEIAE